MAASILFDPFALPPRVLRDPQQSCGYSRRRWLARDGRFGLPFGMPYRIDICCPPPDAVDLLVQLGALDIESANDGIAAIMPDGVTQDTVAGALGLSSVTVSAAVARDNSSVWLLSPRTVRIGNVLIASPEVAASSKALRLTDSNAFGTGHHPSTALCVEALEEILSFERLDSVLDVGTGSGILALTALMMGVPQAVGLDTDADALRVATENARLNNFAGRLQLVLGGPSAVDGDWPLVVANVLAAPLIEMAPVLVRRVGRRGRLILSGIPSSLESEVRRTYQHLGLRQIGSKTRTGWTMLMAQASW
ncbi:MAG: 50S ribosomal protein L11 methyltransferase [Acidobacteriota bacterium]|nr:50S ribosomal protein L11 methyltransferase [Acidobacteriota bacterium]